MYFVVDRASHQDFIKGPEWFFFYHWSDQVSQIFLQTTWNIEDVEEVLKEQYTITNNYGNEKQKFIEEKKPVECNIPLSNNFLEFLA